MSSKKPDDLATNKRAFHDYEILETYEAGIALMGTEIKSLREGGASLQESYVKIIKNEAYLLGAHIAPYTFGNIYNHTEKRDRKLLLHQYEIKKLKKSIQEKGLTIVPIAMYLNKKGICKVKIGIAKGKKLHDKRADIKAKEEKRFVQREMKSN